MTCQTERNVRTQSCPGSRGRQASTSFTVEKFGVERLVGLTQDQVDERVQEFIDLVQFDISLV